LSTGNPGDRLKGVGQVLISTASVACVGVTADDDADRPDNPKELERRVQKEENQMRDKLKELFSGFNHRLFDSLLKMAKTSIDLLRKRLFYQP